MSNWNFRILMRMELGKMYYFPAEVYYDDNGKPEFWCDAHPGAGNLITLREDLIRIAELTTSGVPLLGIDEEGRFYDP